MIDTLWRAVARLAAGGDVERDYPGSRVTQADYARAIAEYGRTLVPPPRDAYAAIEPVLADPPAEGVWAVDAPLWTAEEGRSDLLIEATVAMGENGVDVMIDDMRVP